MNCLKCKSEIENTVIYCNTCGHKYAASSLDILEENLNKLGNLSPQPDFDYYFKRGNEIAQQGNLYEALEYFNKAISIRGSTSCYSHRGLCYLMLNKREEAMADFNFVIGLQPTNIMALGSRGVLLMEQKLYLNAIRDFDEIIQINPKDEIALSNRAYSKYHLEHYDSALSDISAALGINPDDPYYIYVLAKIQLKLGQTKEGISNLKFSAQRGYNFAKTELSELGL